MNNEYEFYLSESNLVIEIKSGIMLSGIDIVVSTTKILLNKKKKFKMTMPQAF